jgi:hypothetical protein
MLEFGISNFLDPFDSAQGGDLFCPIRNRLLIVNEQFLTKRRIRGDGLHFPPFRIPSQIIPLPNITNL